MVSFRFIERPCLSTALGRTQPSTSGTSTHTFTYMYIHHTHTSFAKKWLSYGIQIKRQASFQSDKSLYNLAAGVSLTPSKGHSYHQAPDTAWLSLGNCPGPLPQLLSLPGPLSLFTLCRFLPSVHSLRDLSRSATRTTCVPTFPFLPVPYISQPLSHPVGDKPFIVPTFLIDVCLPPHPLALSDSL